MYQKIHLAVFLITALYFCSIVDGAAQERRTVTSPETNHHQETLGAVGPHHREWVVPDARDRTESRYIQLQTGLMRQLETGEWVETSSEIELFRDGAIARKTRHQVIFSPDSADPNGVFDVLMPGGKRLRGLCIGIAYTEKSTGRSVFVAETKSVAGELVGVNEIVYRDCFEGEVRADLVYRNTSAGMAQDVVLRSRIPAPADYGFEGEVALEVWTAFVEAPEASKHDYERRRKGGQLAADCIIDFGSMRIGEGRAFPAKHGAMDDADLTAQIPVHKAYELLEGSLFLIESVPYADAVESVANLPGLLEARKIDKQGLEEAFAQVVEESKDSDGSTSKLASAGPTKSGGSENRGRRSKPISFIAKTTEKPSDLKIARAKKTDIKLAGYVVDFDLSDGTQTSFTFKADTTYYVSGTVYLNGMTTVEGGTVIKFANTNSPQLIVNTTGSLNMKTAPYNPAIFCAKDDNTVGATISGSSGSPSGTYAQTAIGYWVASPMTVKHVQVRNCDYAVYHGNYLGDMENVISDVQFINCGRTIVISGTDLYLRNVLFFNCTRAFWTSNTDFKCENVTFNRLTSFEVSSGSTFAATNCIFSNAGTLPASLAGAYNITNNTEANIFQTIGGAKHYLLSDAVRNTGTANINATLAALLRERTTYPPIVLSDVSYNGDLQLYPVVQR